MWKGNWLCPCPRQFCAIRQTCLCVVHVAAERCKNAVLRVQKGPEMREICGTIEGTSLAKEAVVSVGDTETIQYVSLCLHFLPRG